MKITIKRAQNPSLFDVLPSVSNLRAAKKIYFLVLVVLLQALIITGCKENEPLEYENDPALYFYNGIFGNGLKVQRDSLSQSFFLLHSSILRDTVYLRMCIMGDLSGEDRIVSLVQTNAGEDNAAAPNVHYIPFDDPEVKYLYVIPAGKAMADIPVIFLRDESLSEDEYRLELTIGENEYFRRGIPDWQDFLVKTTAQIAKPNNWDTVLWYAFGNSWGQVKMQFIVDVTGISDWESVPTNDITYILYLGNFVKQKYSEYNLANPDKPLKEKGSDNPISFTS